MLFHVSGPLGVLFGAFVGGHLEVFAMVKSLAAALAGQVLAIEQRGETRRRRL